MAMLFEHRARARGASSAATEERKIIGVPQRGKIVLSEKTGRFIKSTDQDRLVDN